VRIMQYFRLLLNLKNTILQLFFVLILFVNLLSLFPIFEISQKLLELGFREDGVYSCGITLLEGETALVRKTGTFNGHR